MIEEPRAPVIPHPSLARRFGRPYTSNPMKRLALLVLCLIGAASLRAEDPATFPVGGLTFKRPADWSWVAVSSPMRKAQLKVPGAKPEESADITFFHFGPDGGGDIQSNAQRWVSQFRAPEGTSKIESQEIGGANEAENEEGEAFHRAACVEPGEAVRKAGMRGGRSARRLNHFPLTGSLAPRSPAT